MAKKNRNKNKKKKKEKESDGSTGNVNGGGNSNNNDNNNDITSPSMDATTTTTIVLTTEEIERIDITFGLKGYPKSKGFLIGYRQLISDQKDPAIASFKRGAQNDGCVPCMCFYVYTQDQRDIFHLGVPIALEAAIRGHIHCMDFLMHCYKKSKTAISNALISYWMKTRIELGGTDTQLTEDRRKENKKRNANSCCVCGTEESKDNDDVTLVKCGTCKYYTYCSKKCQTYQWKEGKHMNECRQVILLRKYCKLSYVQEIRAAVIEGQDPKEIHTLQRLRMKLGLNRPQEEYEELVLILSDDDTNDTNKNPNRYEYLVGRKDGTVHIGSTPNVI